MNGNASKSAAYSSREKVLLAQLVKENNIVENKRTDGATILEKKKAWKHITIVYNSQPEVNIQRKDGQLRKLWNNLKQRKRKETTALRHSMLTTGGGPPPPKRPVLDLDFIEDAAPNLDVNIDCPWDSTELFENRQTKAKSQLEEAADKAPFQLEVNEVVEEIFDPPLFPSSSKFNDEQTSFINTNAAVSGAPVECKKGQPSSSTPKSKKVVAASVLRENDIRRRKLDEATQQQQQLHEMKIKIAEEELVRVAEIKKQEIRRAEFLTQTAEMDLQRAKIDLQRATDEAELASLKLRQFKKRCFLKICSI